MSDPIESPKPGILYVDDEEKALKYFAKAFGRDFTIRTAINAEAGMEILENEAETIALIVSDQRMPETTGVEFLTKVRSLYPNKIRILTTAYSDLDSAIQSVNQGRIYQYVVKPWDLQDFQMVLRRAYDFYSILSERNDLMSIKMTTFQRIVLADRTKTLQILSNALEEEDGERLSTALYSLVQALPPSLDAHPAGAGLSFMRGGLRDFMKQEREAYEKILSFWKASGLKSVDGLESLADGLRETFPGASIVSDLSGFGKSISLSIKEDQKSDLLNSLFGILIEPDPSSVSLELLRSLPALKAESAELTISVEGQTLVKFSPKALPEDSALEEELARLYDSWDTMTR